MFGCSEVGIEIMRREFSKSEALCGFLGGGVGHSCDLGVGHSCDLPWFESFMSDTISIYL